MVCPNCRYHGRFHVGERLKITVDKGTFHEYDRDMRSVNPIGFEGYGEKLQRLSKATALQETEELLEKRCIKFRKSGEFTRENRNLSRLKKLLKRPKA